MELMRKICEELQNIEKDFLLTDTQKAILLLIHVSETSAQAYEVCSGTEAAARARSLLENIGMIERTYKKLFLTQKGDKVLIDYNLIDDVGEPTELGTKVLDNYKKTYDSTLKTESSLIKEIF
jgi:hypothetical protein